MPSHRKTALFVSLLRWLLTRVRLSASTFARVPLQVLFQLWKPLWSLASRYTQVFRKDRHKVGGKLARCDWQGPFLASLDPSSPSTGHRPPSIAASTDTYYSLDGIIVEGAERPSEIPTRFTLDRPYHSAPELTTPSTPSFERMDYPEIQGNAIATSGSIRFLPGSCPSSPRPTSISMDPTPIMITQDITEAWQEVHSANTNGTRTATPTLEMAPGPSECDYLRKHNVIGIDIDSVQRYQRAPIANLCSTNLTIPPMQLQFTRGVLPMSWKEYLHPEGVVYFHHEQEGVLTDADMYDNKTRARIETAMCHIAFAKRRYSTELPPDIETVLELPDTHNDHRGDACYYYCISHRHRTLFWLDSFDASSMLCQIKYLSNEAQIRHELESQYWNHWEYYPLERKVSAPLMQEAVGTLFYGAIDQKTSSWSTFPFTAEDATDFLDLIKNIDFTKEVRGFSAVSFGRIMSQIAHSKFMNHHGSPEARLNIDQRRHPDVPRPPSLFIRLVSPLLFFAPDMHYRQIRNIWVDDTVEKHPWVLFIKNMRFEWDILPATVMLSANLAFLAIPSMSQNPKSPSAPQIASSISTLNNVASIVIGLVLDRSYRVSQQLKVTEMVVGMEHFLSSWDHHGIESLAIIYSLPYAFMMWGMVTFFVACSCQFLQARALSALVFVVPVLGLSILAVWSAIKIVRICKSP